MLQPSEPRCRPNPEFTNLLEAPHNTLPELHSKMTGINQLLPVVGLANVTPFADAYRKITGRANRALEDNAFVDPDTTWTHASINRT